MTTDERPTRVLQRRVAETVAAELRNRILSGADDYRLPPQDQLVQDFGVSYPSIREALRILETEGLVTVRRGNVGGAEVHRPDEVSAAYHFGLALQGGRVTLADLAGGLQTLEPMCVAACARRADRAEVLVPALLANVEATTGCVDDTPAFRHAAHEFHDLVVSYTPNATIRSVVTSLVTLWTSQQRIWAEILVPGGRHPTDAEAREGALDHRRVAEAIADGRAEDAERIYREHLAGTHALVLEHFADVVVNASSQSARHALYARHGV